MEQTMAKTQKVRVSTIEALAAAVVAFRDFNQQIVRDIPVNNKMAIYAHFTGHKLLDITDTDRSDAEKIPRRSEGKQIAHALGQDRNHLAHHRLVQLCRLSRPPGMVLARRMARCAARSTLPVALDVASAGHTFAQSVRSRQPQPRSQNQRARGNHTAS